MMLYIFTIIWIFGALAQVQSIYDTRGPRGFRFVGTILLSLVAWPYRMFYWMNKRLQR